MVKDSLATEPRKYSKYSLQVFNVFTPGIQNIHSRYRFRVLGFMVLGFKVLVGGGEGARRDYATN